MHLIIKEMEKELVKSLGSRIGYGNLMYLASECWDEEMSNNNEPTTGVLVPCLKSEVLSKKIEKIIIKKFLDWHYEDVVCSSSEKSGIVDKYLEDHGCA